jgi:tetratricopeptide (TPR) repeat protein
MALVNFGMALQDTGDLARSRSLFEEALAIRRQQRDKNNTAQVLAALAAISLEQDKLAEAHSLIEESIAIRQQLGEMISLAQSKLVLADILLEEGQLAASEKNAREAIVTFKSVQAGTLEAAGHLALAHCSLARGSAAAAKEPWGVADQLLRESQEVSLLLKRDTLRARIDGALGHKKEASALLDHGLGEAHRFVLTSVQLEIRLAMVELSRTGAAILASDARRAGFLRIARKALV